MIGGCYFGQADDTSVRASGSVINRLSVCDNVFYASDAEAIQVLGGAAAYAATAGEIVIADNLIDGSGMVDSVPCIEVGSASGRIQQITISGNQITSPGLDGIKVYARYGTISGNTARGAGGDGLDLLSSEDILVVGNNFRDATEYGIDASDCTDCVIRANDCAGATTGDIAFSASTDHYDNGDVVAPGPPRTFYTTTNTLTIPADLLHVNDHVRIMHNLDVTGGNPASLILTVDSLTAAVIAIDGTDPGQVQVTAELVVTGTTSFDSMFSAVSESVGAGLAIGRYQQTGLDLTSDIIITATNAGATVARQGLLAELSRAEVQ
jgi:hypothetical protein